MEGDSGRGELLVSAVSEKIKSKFVQADEKLVCYWSSGVAYENNVVCERTSSKEALLKWNEYYSNNVFPLGIICVKCGKCRKVVEYQESSEVPEYWDCSMWKRKNNMPGNCDIPSDVTAADFADEEFTPGSIVWAKLGGYPSWPGMVEDCPDKQEYFISYVEGDEYHINFFGDRPMRSWVPAKRVTDFSKPSPSSSPSQKIVGRLPAEWKRAIIIPIKKAGKNNWSPKDFRPIALTSTTCKIMEKMILIRIQYFLDSKNLIPGEQYGYRRGHSTVDQIISFCQSIRDAQNCKPTHHTMAALLDLTKAFDRVWKHKLLIKLHDTFNILGNTLAWISDFLHHRSMRVNFNNTFSDPVVLGQGVPQGSVLSPTLFSLYLAGIEKIPSVEMRVGLFADNIVIWCSGRDLVEMERNLNNAFSSFSDYALEFKLCFNPTKSIATFFTTNKRLYSYQPTLKMDNKNLAYEKHPKYLGYVLDPEWSSHKHIDHIVSKCRKRLSILKFIAGKDWGADAVTLRDTFLALIRPILEYGFPVYCCASAASLEKLEKIQLGAARIITGLRHSCPKEIVLFEADLQPLHLRSKNILTNYFNKLSSYGHHNKTSLYFNNWHNNQRLKRNSPFSYADHLQGTSQSPLPLQHVCPVTKQDLIPAHLRQLALESINEIPCDAIKIYTDGSRLDDCAGSGIYIENSGQNFYFCHRNPDFSSVFKSELTAIKLGLEAIINESDYGELWILSDSRSSLQHLHNWTQVGDKTSISILHNLKLISKHHDVHFQWIPSHVDIFGNEQADRLAREGCSLLTTSSPAITYSEHQSKINRQLSKQWKIPPSHHWYAAREPGSFLDLNCDRASKTAISRLASGHTKSLSFFEGRKTFKFCSKCKVQQASAEHILDCLGLSREDLYDSPLLVIDFLRVNNLMDLV
ncbi:probable RNA-directed DNA polymerase from transposon BS [Trichonephila clavipes]|nr:probable RNA-directed DNA polymerase from transposon BS [Trichonephila clavipes]